MAFTAIPNSLVDAESSIDVTLMTYLRDNDDYLKARFATTGGHNHDGSADSGSPIVVPDGSITTIKLVNGAATSEKLGYVTNGNYIVCENNTERNTSSTAAVILKESFAGPAGSYTAIFDLRENLNLGGGAYGRIYVNGSPVGTQRSTTSQTYITYEEIIEAVPAGGLIQVYGFGTVSPAGSAYVRNFILRSNKPVGAGAHKDY